MERTHTAVSSAEKEKKKVTTTTTTDCQRINQLSDTD